MTLLARVDDWCERLLEDDALAPLHPIVRRERERLREPLRVAVCGPLSAGKSTLVNALIGRAVAVTGRAETTEANWWFRAGHPESICLRRPGGGWAEQALAGGPPDALGAVDLDAVDAIEVRLDSEFLEGMTVIDTPGLFSPNAERSERADALLKDRTTRAMAHADALIYVTSELPGAARDDDRLRDFQALFGPVSRAPTNALLVLTKVDRWWAPREPRTPLEIGRELLAAHRDELRRRVWDTLPVIGLLATPGAAVDDDLVADLRTLAASPDRHLLQLGRALLLKARSDVPAERRADLYDGLGAYGLQRALELVESGHDTPAALAAELAAASGVDAVRGLIDSTLRDRSDVLRADALLSALERLALARQDGLAESAATRLRGSIEGLRTGPQGAALRALDGLRRAADHEVPLSTVQRTELRRLFAGSDWSDRLGPLPDGIRPAELAMRRREAWRVVENRRPAPLALRRIGAQARQAYEDVLAEVSGDA
jgi:hypothetical protein